MLQLPSTSRSKLCRRRAGPGEAVAVEPEPREGEEVAGDGASEPVGPQREARGRWERRSKSLNSPARPTGISPFSHRPALPCLLSSTPLHHHRSERKHLSAAAAGWHLQVEEARPDQLVSPSLFGPFEFALPSNQILALPFQSTQRSTVVQFDSSSSSS
jgi:hypothetical protein